MMEAALEGSSHDVATSQSGPHHGCEGTHYYLPKRTGWRTMESHRPRARLNGPAVCSHMDSPLWRAMYAPVLYAEINKSPAALIIPERQIS